MVIVIVDFKVTEVIRVLPILAELRREALRQQGYISGNTLIGAEDPSQICIETIWESVKEWKDWEKSQAQIKLFRKIMPYLSEKTKIKIYRYLSYHTEAHMEDAGQDIKI